MPFVFSLTEPVTLNEDGLVFLFDRDRMLVKKQNGSEHVPSINMVKNDLSALPSLFSFGTLEGKVCYSGDLGDKPDDFVTDSMSFISLRKLFHVLPEEHFRTAFCAIHSSQWFAAVRFCGKCGNMMRLSDSEPAKVCDRCGYLQYPRISPAVIVAVVKDDQILLGHSGRFPDKLYSVIAGFVEPGETLEACVVREVKEETGIDVDNVRYFGSQPWPFPDSLMIGFTARYAGGTICVDGKEMIDANWFSAGNLPNIPQGVSISRDLIDWFVNKNS